MHALVDHDNNVAPMVPGISAREFPPTLSPKALTYPQELLDLIRECEAKYPEDRPTIGDLWTRIWEQVGTFRGLREIPMKLGPRPGDEGDILYTRDTNLEWAT